MLLQSVQKYLQSLVTKKTAWFTIVLADATYNCNNIHCLREDLAWYFPHWTTVGRRDKKHHPWGIFYMSPIQMDLVSICSKHEGSPYFTFLTPFILRFGGIDSYKFYNQRKEKSTKAIMHAQHGQKEHGALTQGIIWLNSLDHWIYKMLLCFIWNTFCFSVLSFCRVSIGCIHPKILKE